MIFIIGDSMNILVIDGICILLLLGYVVYSTNSMIKSVHGKDNDQK